MILIKCLRLELTLEPLLRPFLRIDSCVRTSFDHSLRRPNCPDPLRTVSGIHSALIRVRCDQSKYV